MKLGLYDAVKCEYPLPEPAHGQLEFQTKDLEHLLEDYTITADGRLVRHAAGGLFGRGPLQDVEWPIHGDLRLLARSPEPSGGGAIEYVFRFTNGRVEWVRRIDRSERGRPVADEPHVHPSAPPADPRLSPGLHGRRLTVEEFQSFTPEKLELVDGRIPGDEPLLRLLLVGLGLLRAVELVGADVWAEPLAERR